VLLCISLSFASLLFVVTFSSFLNKSKSNDEKSQDHHSSLMGTSD
jgi:hypothetical protein